MKLPNGFGSVYKLSGKRRNPWIARKTSGWETNPETGKAVQKYITIGYYHTKQDALTALGAYNENPYDINAQYITFAEVYEKWSAEHFEEIVPSARRSWISCYNHSKPLHNMKMKDIRPAHMEGCIHDAEVGSATKQRMKSMYNLMYRYALKHDIVEKDYAALCNSVKSDAPVIQRIPFSSEEIKILWNSLDVPFVDMILIGIYSGWRPQELAVLKIADVDLDTGIFRGGLKTEAGKNRIVPIHSSILPLVRRRYDEAIRMGSKYLFNDPEGQQGTSLTYDKYRGRWNKAMLRVHMHHRPHDTRHTFITLAKNAGIDEYILKLIAGHSIRDITEKVYTHRTIEQLHEEIEKICK